MGDAAALSLAPGFDSGILRLGGPAEAGYRRRTTTSSAQLSNPPGEEARLLRSLRNGDEQAFTRLLHEYSPAMLRVAMLYVGSRAVAEEVVQEAWLGAITGLPRFEGRSTLKTWVFRILTNIAKTRAVREGRTVPFSSLESDDDGNGGAAVDPSRFHPPGSAWAGHWDAARAPARPGGELLRRAAGG